MMKPQDLLVALKLLSAVEGERTFPRLAAALGMSASEVHAAVKRAVACGLVDGATRTVRKSSLLEFLVHGLRYVYPPEWRGVTRGIPTSHAAPPLLGRFVVDELPPVWPHPQGTSRGEGLVPLYKSVPDAALQDLKLYEWLALADAVRSGKARERRMAADEMKRRLSA
jgi:hypothetical protein